MLKGSHHSKKTKDKMSRAQSGENNPMYGKNQTKEAKEINRLAHLGENNFNFGKHLSDEAKEKLRIINLKENLSSEKIEKMRLAKIGKLFSEEHKNNISKTRKELGLAKGKNNPMFGKLGEDSTNWKGGTTPLNFQIRGSFEYRQWRSDVFTRDNFTCQDCGDNTGGNLEAHHKKCFSSILQYYEITTLEQALECKGLWNINNGITLCEDCHKKIHSKIIENLGV